MTENLRGIDISHWQAGIDLEAADIDFIMMKTSEGTDYVDPEWPTYRQQADAIGMRYGFYHFYRGGGAAEADHFLTTLDYNAGTGVLALDFEDPAHLDDVYGALSFLNRIRDVTGILPLIYMSRSTLQTNDWTNVAAAGYGLWFARWGVDEPGDVSPWPAPTIWQYTDAQPYPGRGVVDADTFYGDVAEWDALGSGTTPEPEPDPITPLISGGEMFTVENRVPGTSNLGQWWIVVPQGKGKPRATTIGEPDIVTGAAHVAFALPESWRAFQDSVDFV